MPLTIPERITERIRREAEKQGLAPEEYVLKAITRDLDPDERAREYIESASALLEQAREELQKGDLRQASEKVWGACALAIEAHAAAKKGLVPKSHADLWLYKEEVANELGEWIRDAFLMADSMHKNFYEGLATAKDVTVAFGEVEKLVKAIREVLK
jgi:alkyl sulfatase BDS1-like metallo-beta-lactamase superfamily hydrolase